MPEGSKVEKVYRALREEGMDKAKAARISQAQTGQALATGKPPKHENAGLIKVGDTVRDGFGATREVLAVRGNSLKLHGLPNDWIHVGKVTRVENAEGTLRGGSHPTSAFQNGATRATQEIENSTPYFEEGYKARMKGVEKDNCPYRSFGPKRQQWLAGWEKGDSEKMWKGTPHFQNGASRATQEIENKMRRP